MTYEHKSSRREGQSHRVRTNSGRSDIAPGIVITASEVDTRELPAIGSTGDLEDIVERTPTPKAPEERPVVYYITQENDNSKIYTRTSNPARMGEFEIKDKKGRYDSLYKAQFALTVIKEELRELGIDITKMITYANESSQKDKGKTSYFAAVKVTATEAIHSEILEYLSSTDYKDNATKRQTPTSR